MMLARAFNAATRSSSLAGNMLPAFTRAFSGTSLTGHPKVNQTYKTGGDFGERVPTRVDDNLLTGEEILARDAARTWEKEDLDAYIRNNTLFTWGASGPYADSVIHFSHGEGNFLVDVEGKKYLDFNSQAMCSHYGHTNDEIAKAVSDQIEKAGYVYPCTGVHPIKAQLSTLLADFCPGDINTFFYTSGGTEANESAIRMVRQFTGRNKILARYRSYHGGTNGSMALSGDFRRWPVENTGIMPGVVRVMDPFPYNFDWGCGEDEAKLTKQSLDYLEEVILYEGPDQIAAMWIESVVGTNGILKAPKGYLEGLRAILSKYGILLVCDEVMAGFGRTGKRFGFMNSDPCIVPDVITMAKGINGAFIPLGALGVSDEIAEFYKSNPVNIGSTYGAHSVALASAYAAIKFHLKHDLTQRAADLQPVLEKHMGRLADKHRCVKQARVHGLFGVIEPQRNMNGDWLIGYPPKALPAQAEFKKALYDGGLYTMMRLDQLFINPPLTITEEELEFGFDVIDKALPILTNAMED